MQKTNRERNHLQVRNFKVERCLTVESQCYTYLF